MSRVLHSLYSSYHYYLLQILQASLWPKQEGQLAIHITLLHIHTKNKNNNNKKEYNADWSRHSTPYNAYT